ncbi:hypothetical protein [Spirosoma endophyticum]|uniref:Uncharacterized protein n=1 Tax=Spirosoma endophyticum TaxID=662367 RepID=A0A1I2GY96_9BACT|nr:hypothetical protein [Spirosoma endophyticum]SFF22123.1 hypothetical protein SAMN05216167_13624 [Spirosoma endophyticum]
MPFEPGKPKTGGRQSGSTNKTTSDIKTRIAALINDQFETIQGDMEELEPKERVTAYLKFLEYVLPKQREQKIDLTSRLEGLSDEQLNELIDQILNKP